MFRTEYTKSTENLKTHIVSRKSVARQSPCSLPLALCYSVSRQTLTTHNSQLTTHNSLNNFPVWEIELKPNRVNILNRNVSIFIQILS